MQNAVPHDQPSTAQSDVSSSQDDKRTPAAGAGIRWHDLAGLAVQCIDTHRTLIIDGFWVRLAPLEYQVLLPLIKRFNQPTPVETICDEAFGNPYSDADATRLYRAFERARPQLAVFGLEVTSLYKKRGYMLWRCDTSTTVRKGKRSR